MNAAEQGICYHIYGRVQGVGFRHFTWKTAQALNVRGTVQNLADGTVFVEAVQQASILKNFRQRLSKGPVFAKVTQIEEFPLDVTKFEGATTFQILR